MFCLGACAYFVLLDPYKGKRWSVGIHLSPLRNNGGFRKTQVVESHLLTLFCSYRTIWEGNEKFSNQAIMNVVAVVPIRLLLVCTLKRIRWWGVLYAVRLFSFTLKYSSISFIVALLDLMISFTIPWDAWLGLG